MYPSSRRVIVFSDVPPLGNEGVSMSVLAHRLTACLGTRLDHLVTRRYSQKYPPALIGSGLPAPTRLAWDCASTGLRFLRGKARTKADRVLMRAWTNWAYRGKKRPADISEIIGLSGPHWHFLPRLRTFAQKLNLPFSVYVIDDYEVTAKHAKDTGARVEVIGEHLRAAHRVLAICPGMAERLKVRFEVESEILYPVADQIENLQSTPVQVKPGTIAYVGSLGPAYIETIVGAAEQLSSIEDTKWEMNIISRDRKTFEARLARIPCVTLHADCDRHELRERVASAEVQLIPYSFSEAWSITAETSFPSKFMDAVVSGRPAIVFAPDYASITRHMLENQCAFTANSPQDFTKLLRARPWSRDETWRSTYWKLVEKFHSAESAKRILTSSP